MSDKQRSKASLTTGFGQAMGLSAELVATTVVGLALGWLVSRWLGNLPLFLLLGTFLGGAAGVTRLYRVWKRQT